MILEAESCKLRAAFTLVELLVSIGIFAVITTIAVGGFVSVLKSERQVAGLLAANSNISLSIEQMAREMRTGYNFCTVRSCLLSELNFRNARGDDITYRLQSGAIERRVNSSPFQKITADNVDVKYLKFYLQGREAGDGQQPRVTIALGVAPKGVGLKENITNLQTTVSARLPLDT